MPSEFLIGYERDKINEATRLRRGLRPENANIVYSKAEKYCEKCDTWKINPIITCTRCQIWEVKRSALQLLKNGI
jgi:hypothetical protein